MGRSGTRWLGVVLLLIVAAGGVAWLSVYLSSRGFDWAARFSEIASFVLAALSLVPLVAGKIAQWVPTPKIKDEQVDYDVNALAAALRAQGRYGAVLSGVNVHDRLSMPVRWMPALEVPGTDTRLLQAGAASTDDLTGTFDGVLEFFRRLPEPRLVMLGDAGAGKTVLAAELAQRLLAARQDGNPVPVVVPVMAWDPVKTTLFDWIAEQLVRIYTDLAQVVSDGHQALTRAQVLVDRMKVLPVLDGLDEVAETSRPMATLAINRYGWSQPLVVTCRSETYMEIIGKQPGTPIARAAVIKLLPLRIADIKDYLGPDLDGHWAAIYDRLDAEPGGALAQVVGNPLMLWLAWTIYSQPSSAPDELADRYRFGSTEAIEHHLLAEFVPALYPEGKKDSGWRVWRRQTTRARAERWLGFLASDSPLHRSPPRSRRSKPLDTFESRDIQNVAWWRFTDAAGRRRIFSLLVRGALVAVVLWQLVLTILRDTGNWRDGTYVGHLPFRQVFLDGPLGRVVWPTIYRLLQLVPADTRNNAFVALNNMLRDVLSLPSRHLLIVVLIALPVAGLLVSVYASRPRRVHVKPTVLLRWLADTVLGALQIAFLMWIVLIWWHHADAVGDFFSSRSTWLTVLVLSLVLGVPYWPARLVSSIDVVGAVRPEQSLHADNLAGIFVITSRRALWTVSLGLLCGSRIAFIYLVYAVTSTVVVVAFGGLRNGFASRAYADARFWLAISRRLPWRPMRFLIDADRRGVFQEVGAIYRFRHIRVQLELRDWYDVHRPRARDWWLRYLRLFDLLQARTGDRALSLAGARDRVDGFRKLAAQNPKEFGADLAEALSVQAGFLRELGHRDDELEALRELVITRRRLAETDAEASPDLAESLRQFAHRLADAGQTDEALGLMTESAAIYLQLAKAKPETYLPSLTDLLTWLMQVSKELGRPGDAPHVINAVVDSYCELVRVELDRDRVSHVASLMCLVKLLVRLGRQDDAAAEVNNAVKAYAELPRVGLDTDPAGYAKSLVALAEILEALGRKDDASRATAYSADIYRELARLEPVKNRPLLVESLIRLATLYKKMDRPEELSELTEAVSVYRDAAAEAKLRDQDGQGAAASPRLAPNLPFETPGLSLSRLNSLALRLWKLGAQREAIEAATISAQMAGPGAPAAPPQMLLIGLELSDQPSTPMRPDSVKIFSWLARVRGDEGWEQARAKDWRALADKHDTAAFRLLLTGQDQESRAEAAKAVDCCQELVAVYRHLVSTEPADYLADLAGSLNLLAMQLRKAGSGEEEAEAAASEAQLIRRRLGVGA